MEPKRHRCAVLLILFTLIWTAGCSAQRVPAFDGQNAFRFLEKQCEFGPRNPGSEGYRRCRDYLLETLRLYADHVTTQPFLLTFGQPPTSVNATNIIARFQLGKLDRILLCAHWDTRPWADQDPDPANHRKPILGANDGASGVAVLLEIARILHENPPKVGVDIVFFDGEDTGTSGADRSYAKGSAAFARELGPQFRPRFGILLDMIGDADLAIYKEGFSARYAQPVVDRVWGIAEELGIREFVPQVGYAVFDDHVPLLEAGIPCIDIIDFDYPPWHTMQDTPDKCAPASLEKVGTVLLHLIYQ